MRSAILTCSALFIASGLAQQWQPREGAALHARDAYAEADTYPDADAYADADADPADDDWDLGEPLARRDDLDWAMNVRHVPQFDGHVSRRSLHASADDSHGPRLARRAAEPQSNSWFGGGGGGGGGGSPAQALYNQHDPEVQSHKTFGGGMAGFQGGSPEHQQAMAQHYEAMEREKQRADAYARTWQGKAHGYLNRGYRSMAELGRNPHVQAYGKQLHAHVTPYTQRLNEFRGKMMAPGGMGHEYSQQLNKWRQSPQIAEYEQRMRNVVPKGAQEYASGIAQKFNSMPHAMIHKRGLALREEGEALMDQLERRAALEGRQAHSMAAEEFGSE